MHGELYECLYVDPIKIYNMIIIWLESTYLNYLLHLVLRDHYLIMGFWLASSSVRCMKKSYRHMNITNIRLYVDPCSYLIIVYTLICRNTIIEYALDDGLRQDSYVHLSEMCSIPWPTSSSTRCVNKLWTSPKEVHTFMIPLK